MKNIKTDKGKILFIGIGNCGRMDDGIGWEFADKVSQLHLKKTDCEYRYQLQVEDVLLVCSFDKIIFADASHTSLKDGFELKPCTAASHYYFSSHLQSPETILYLAKELYNKMPEAYTLAIEGQNWGLGNMLSIKAQENLQKALDFFKNEFLLLPVKQPF